MVKLFSSCFPAPGFRNGSSERWNFLRVASHPYMSGQVWYNGPLANFLEVAALPGDFLEI